VKRFTSVAQAQELGLGSQVIEGRGSLLIDDVLVGHQISQADVPMGADLAEGDLHLRQPLDQEGPRHIQQISGLLGGQLGMHRHQRHSIALGHLHQDFPEQLQDRGRDWDGCVVAIFQVQGEAGLPQAVAGTAAIENDEALLCGLGRLSRGEHRLNRAEESHSHGQQGKASRNAVEIIAAIATSARALAWCVLCLLKPLPGQLMSSSLPMRLMLLPMVVATVLAPMRAQAADDNLDQSVEQLRRFPFRSDCDGNTQEIVACLWRQRNQDDATLQQLLDSSALLEQWRTSRRQVCGRAAAKAKGGSIHPLVWLSCENKLNGALIKEISQPLLP
jgi:uncharacterized protein YecT (DUF1311 family)